MFDLPFKTFLIGSPNLETRNKLRQSIGQQIQLVKPGEHFYVGHREHIDKRMDIRLPNNIQHTFYLRKDEDDDRYRLGLMNYHYGYAVKVNDKPVEFTPYGFGSEIAYRPFVIFLKAGDTLEIEPLGKFELPKKRYVKEKQASRQRTKLQLVG